MFRRFAAAASVASVFIGLGGLFVTFIPFGALPGRALALRLWCVAPLAWGLWAMLAPKSWVPDRLPLWGAILGLFAGVFAMLVLDMPHRVFGVDLPAAVRGLGVLSAIGFYFLLWMLVRSAIRVLGAENTRL
ncbi:MAG: hypothetical protein HY046_12735 [Acidobacteria bacterium]|nr:hypothetical protein [Acidobacteriota bacterium]